MRSSAVDNAKLCLIFLVFFGHAIEVVYKNSVLASDLHLIIYSFHMPAFIILSGAFFNPEKVNLKKTYNSIFIPFLVATVVYEGLVYLLNKDFSSYLMQFAPHWILWFLYSLMIWQLITPRFFKLNNPVLISVFLSILAMTPDLFGYEFGLARTFTFFPFFIIGLKYKSSFLRLIGSQKVFGVAMFLALSLLVITTFNNHGLWFGSVNMVRLGYGFIDGFLVKTITFAISILMAVSFLMIIPVGDYWFTKYGENTLYVYLGHGFLIRLFSALGGGVMLTYTGEFGFILAMILFSLVGTVILSQPIFKVISDWVFGFFRLT